MRPRPVETLAGVPAFVRGVSIIRGDPVPVVDLGAVIGTAAPASPSRFVTLRLGQRTVALAVGDVVGVRGLDRERLEEMPPLLRGASTDLIQALGSLDAQLLVVLRAGRIVGSEIWTELEARQEES
jgi:purine-binding chemotaxis protein CheW